MNELYVLFCPPLSEFKEQPKDMSACEIIDCPTCGKKMWFSIKKKEIKKMAESKKIDILLECYNCFSKRVRQNAEEFRDHIKVDI